MGAGLDRVLAALAEQGKTVIPRNGQYSAQCPAHDDRTPSLSISQGTEGALVNCQVGCDVRDVVAALNLTLKDLFDVPQERASNPSRVVAEYEYTDERGALLFVKQRVEPGKDGRRKDFKIYRPLPGGQKAWGLKGVDQRPLYRLPRVAEAVAKGERVFIVEGEKCVAAAERAGAVATCNFDGAAKPGQRTKWRPEYSEALKDAHVVIVADNDDAGYAHARAAADDLKGKAASVRVVRGQVDVEHADLFDHLAAGHGLDDLLPVNATPPPADEWEDPIPLGMRTELPPFPVDVLPAYVGAMVVGVAEEIQVPADLPGALALAVLATAAGGRAEVQVRGQWREPLNLQIGVAMPPGAGKSPTFKAMLAPLYAAEADLRENAKQAIKDADKDRRKAIANAEEARKKAKTDGEIETAIQAAFLAEEMEVPVLPRLTADDVTPEQASTILAEQGGRLAVLSAEGTFLEILMGRYSSGKPNLALMLKGHAGDRLQVDRRGREEFVERPALTIGLCLQPSMLKDVASKKEMHGRGALARLLFSLPADLVGNRNISSDVVPAEVIRDYDANVRPLIVGLAGWADPAIIAMSPLALKLHTEWRTEIEPRLRRGTGDLEALREWASKLAGHTVRLAGLLHIAEKPQAFHREVISEETMERGIRLARYYAEHAMAAFGVMRAHPLLDDARAVLEWIGERKDFKPRDVLRAMRRFSTTDEVSAVLHLLEDHGFIRLAPTTATRGRPSIVYQVNPNLGVKA